MNGTLGMGMWVLCKSQVNFGTQSCYGNEHKDIQSNTVKFKKPTDFTSKCTLTTPHQDFKKCNFPNFCVLFCLRRFFLKISFIIYSICMTLWVRTFDLLLEFKILWLL